MKILTKQNDSCPYFVKRLPVIDQGWSIFLNNYFVKLLYWPKFLGWSKFPRNLRSLLRQFMLSAVMKIFPLNSVTQAPRSHLILGYSKLIQRFRVSGISSICYAINRQSLK